MTEALSGKPLELVHKLVFLANEFPDKNMGEVAGMFQLPGIDVNVAIWRAQDMGLLEVEDTETESKITLKKTPDEWQLGEMVDALKASLLYTFERLARDEMDLEENMLGNWCAGYPAHDVMIAMKSLVNERKIADYDIRDTYELPLSKKKKARGEKPTRKESVYTFFTLFENVENRWGEKQFKDREKLK